MFKIIKLLLAAVIVNGLVTGTLWSQSLNLSVRPSTQQHSSTIFPLNGNSVMLEDNFVKFLDNGRQITGFATYGISPGQSAIGFLKTRTSASQALVLNANADTLSVFAPSKLRSDDPSLAIYPFSDGRSIIRQNIGRFVLYDPLGRTRHRYTSVTGTRGGESISQLATGAHGESMVFYTPKVLQNGKKGSRAHIAMGNGDLKRFFISPDRVIKKVNITANGRYVGLLTIREGTQPKLSVFDRYGNALTSMRFENEIKGFSISEDAKTLMVYSDSRALAYKLLTGEKLGSTSFRSTLVYADYFHEDHTIIALSGRNNQESGKIRNVEFHAIHLEQREIASKKWSGVLGRHPRIDLQLKRTNPNRYILKGTSKEIEVTTNF